jgi:acyl-CoA synthetase (AMP-forming)/AMP-acid ligase II
MHIADDLKGWAERTPDAPFLIDESGTVFTYQEVLGRAQRLAAGLRRQGVQPADRVLFLLPNGIDYLSAYYGTLLVGGTAVGLAMATAPRALAHVVENCQPNICITDPARDYPALAEIGVEHTWTVEELENEPPFDELPLGGGTELAQIIYTSGTTGTPKGVMLSHRALRSNTTGIVEYLSLTSEDRVGVVLDFVYSYGNSLLQTHCRVGGSMALLGAMAFPARVVKLLRDRECTGLSGVPSTFAMLLQRGKLDEHPAPSLRYLTCAGGALPAANLRRLQRALPDVEVFLMYGQTEASARLSYLPTSELPSRPNSIGKGMPGVALQVLDERGEPVTPGQEGEIVASGENLMSGYWDDAETSRQVLRDGGLWTGDLATVDDEGFIFITGRRSDLIKTGAYRVHPKEIEEAIISMDGVHECVVIGVPDEIWGETIIACFRQGSSPLIADVRRHLRDVLPDYKWPRQIAEVEEIPRTASGKPKRQELRKTFLKDVPPGGTE